MDLVALFTNADVVNKPLLEQKLADYTKKTLDKCDKDIEDAKFLFDTKLASEKSTIEGLIAQNKADGLQLN